MHRMAQDPADRHSTGTTDCLLANKYVPHSTPQAAAMHRMARDPADRHSNGITDCLLGTKYVPRSTPQAAAMYRMAQDPADRHSFADLLEGGEAPSDGSRAAACCAEGVLVALANLLMGNNQNMQVSKRTCKDSLKNCHDKLVLRGLLLTKCSCSVTTFHITFKESHFGTGSHALSSQPFSSSVCSTPQCPGF